MDARAAKLALARKKLRDHQEKKTFIYKEESICENNEVTGQESSGVDANENMSPIQSQIGGEFEKSQPQIVNPIDLNQNNTFQTSVPEVNVTEILISNKRTLELSVIELQYKLSQIEDAYSATIADHNMSKQKINYLETELKNIHDKHQSAIEEVQLKEKVIENLQAVNSSLSDEKNNLIDQLEFTKTILTTKETENDSLHSQLYKLQSQLNATQLHLQQITNGSADCITQSCENQDNQQNGALQQKILNLEQQIKMLRKERDQISSHYEHYVSELNNQLKTIVAKNEELTIEVQSLTNRENNLIDQISDMEIRLQNYHTFKETLNTKMLKTDEIKELQQNYENSKETIKGMSCKYEELRQQLLESEDKIKDLSQDKGPKCKHEDISLSKLNADIASDKVAAQRATEQNKKLKANVHELEEAFVKLSQDKLELVEKLTAEKFLNRELTIKLAEVDEKAKEMHIKLMAKDEEMIRLQSRCRDTVNELDQLAKEVTLTKDNIHTSHEDKENDISLMKSEDRTNENAEINDNNLNEIGIQKQSLEVIEINPDIAPRTINKCISSGIPKEDAMLKLQERFLKIMGEVADLSDEKHRLEHIILQLQNETDTICEYVALYQQQRCLLKKRDEERSAQIKIFQAECDRLRMDLEELGAILLKFANDAKLSSYFLDELKKADMAKVMDLLSNLKHSSLIDPKKVNLDLHNFYPCSCCSGQLIDV